MASSLETATPVILQQVWQPLLTWVGSSRVRDLKPRLWFPDLIFLVSVSRPRDAKRW
jgi:hypothetical protein